MQSIKINQNPLLRIPQKMKDELSQSTTFEDAKKVFIEWEKKQCYVSPLYQEKTWWLLSSMCKLTKKKRGFY